MVPKASDQTGDKMTIGAGIAIAGVWMFAAIMGTSKNVTNAGIYIALVAASIVTASIMVQ